MYAWSAMHARPAPLLASQAAHCSKRTAVLLAESMRELVMSMLSPPISRKNSGFRLTEGTNTYLSSTRGSHTIRFQIGSSPPSTISPHASGWSHSFCSVTPTPVLYRLSSRASHPPDISASTASTASSSITISVSAALAHSTATTRSARRSGITATPVAMFTAVATVLHMARRLLGVCCTPINRHNTTNNRRSAMSVLCSTTANTSSQITAATEVHL